MSKLKPYIRRCLCSMILAAFSSCAVAQVVSVEAKGKDEKVARTNACVAAARQMMLQMTEDSFVKSHGKQIRSEIISKADSFVTSVKIRLLRLLNRSRTVKHWLSGRMLMLTGLCLPAH